MAASSEVDFNWTTFLDDLDEGATPASSHVHDCPIMGSHNEANADFPNWRSKGTNNFSTPEPYSWYFTAGNDTQLFTQNVNLGQFGIDEASNYQTAQDVSGTLSGDMLQAFSANSSVNQVNFNIPIAPYEYPGVEPAQHLTSIQYGNFSNSNQYNQGVDLRSYDIIQTTPAPINNADQALSSSSGRPPICQEPECHGKAFGRQTDLVRHMKTMHSGTRFDCTIPGCHNNRGRGYCRQDKVMEHQWKHHADLGFIKHTCN